MKNYIVYILILMSIVAKAQNLSSGLQAYYTFDGNLLDNTSNNYDLQNGIGSVTYSTVSGSDQSIYFDGSDRVDQIGSFDNITWTSSAISIWVKSSTINTLDQIIIQGAYMGFSIFISDNSGYIGGFFQSSSATAYYNSINTADNNWHHIVYQTDGTSIYLYIDGIYVGSSSHTLITGNGGAADKLYLGQAIISPRPYTGYVNNCRIYDRMLSECEIALLAGDSNAVTEFTIEEEACEEYYWSNTNETYDVSGLYSDTIQVPGECDSIVVLDLTIHSIDSTVDVSNGVLTSNHTGGLSYEWINCDENLVVGVGQSYSPINNGSYAVIISTDECIDTSSCYSVKGISVDEIKMSAFNVYQSKMNNMVYVNSKDQQTIDRVVVRDLLGKRIMDKEIVSSSFEFELLFNGIYVLELHIGNEVITKKIIK